MIHMLVWHEGQVVRADADGHVAATPRGAYLGCACDADFGETLFEGTTPSIFRALFVYRAEFADIGWSNHLCAACIKELP